MLEVNNLMMEMIIDDPLLFNNVFSDEATFELTRNVNRYNYRYWSNVNPHWKRYNHTQYPQKVNVWAGIFNSRPVGLFFIGGNLYSSSIRSHASRTNCSSYSRYSW